MPVRQAQGPERSRGTGDSEGKIARKLASYISMDPSWQIALLGKACKACFRGNMRPSWSCVLLPCLACTILLATGCGRRETPVQAGIRDQVLLVGNGSEPRDLDPHVVVSYNDFNIVVALF